MLALHLPTAQAQYTEQIWITFSEEELRGHLIAAVAKFERTQRLRNAIRVTTQNPPESYERIFARMANQDRRRKLVDEEGGWMVINLAKKDVDFIEDRLEEVFQVKNGRVYIRYDARGKPAMP